jgi:hypothetical protein
MTDYHHHLSLYFFLQDFYLRPGQLQCQ